MVVAAEERVSTAPPADGSRTGRLIDSAVDPFKKTVRRYRTTLRMFLDVGIGVVLQQTQMNDRERRFPDR
ncbi:hypothetical protein CP556_18330 [Natrinema sp. CBA1119]|nr:hypothetical protein CP556_18330 [Natrinema sp. CBA1119]